MSLKCWLVNTASHSIAAVNVHKIEGTIMTYAYAAEEKGTKGALLMSDLQHGTIALFARRVDAEEYAIDVLAQRLDEAMSKCILSINQQILTAERYFGSREDAMEKVHKAIGEQRKHRRYSVQRHKGELLEAVLEYIKGH